MNASRAYGHIEVYCPDGNLMFRTNEQKLKFYKRNDLVEQTGDNSYKLKFKPAGLGHMDRNRELLEPRENKCVRCGDEDLLTMTRHHVVPTKYRRHFPLFLKSNNHRYIVFLCVDCHAEYNAFEFEFDVLIGRELGLDNSRVHTERLRVERRLTSGIADTLLFKGERLPEKRRIELMESFVSRTGLEPTHDNLVTVRKLRYSVIDEETEYYKLVVGKTKNLYEFQQRWLEHFVESLDPQFLPNDLKILIDGKL